MIASGLIAIQEGQPSAPANSADARYLLFLCVAGVIVMLLGYRRVFLSRQWADKARRATGWVVDHVDDAPLVQFDPPGQNATPGAGPIRFLATDAEGDRPIGAPVPVLFDPKNPLDARLADFRAGPSAWAFVGFVTVAAGLILAWA